MTGKTEADDDAQTATVSEEKFNGTATLRVAAANKRQAKTAAEEFFKEQHGSSPSKVIAEENEYAFTDDDRTMFEVMAADHSSGSLADTRDYEF